ncbi:MAG: hypothetical protein ACKVI4_14000 [Actinomycetales bacterium]
MSVSIIELSCMPGATGVGGGGGSGGNGGDTSSMPDRARQMHCVFSHPYPSGRPVSITHCTMPHL